MTNPTNMNLFIYQSIWLGISLAITFVYLLSWVKFQKYQFLERDYTIVAKYSNYSHKWHFFKGLNQSIFFYIMFTRFGLQTVLVDLTAYWIFFDGWLNLSVLNRNFFYVGSTSSVDKLLQLISSGIQTVYKKTTPQLVTGVIKIGTLIGTLLYFYK